jgi:hypothetical protein
MDGNSESGVRVVQETGELYTPVPLSTDPRQRDLDWEMMLEQLGHLRQPRPIIYVLKDMEENGVFQLPQMPNIFFIGEQAWSDATRNIPHLESPAEQAMMGVEVRFR